MPNPIELLEKAKAGDAAAAAELRALAQRRSLALQVRADSADTVARTVRATLSTETPVPMIDWDRWEIVPEILRADGCQAPAQVPLLDAHCRDSILDVLGSVREIAPTEGAVDGLLCFAGTDDAIKAFGLVSEGHATDVSVGYDPIARTYVKAGETATVGGKDYTGPCNVVTTWRLYEASMVPIGADPAAKLRHQLISLVRNFKTEEPPVATETQPPNVTEIESAARAAERARVEKIMGFADKFGEHEAARQFVKDGRSVEEFMDHLAEQRGKRTNKPTADLDMPPGERKRYSLLRALTAHHERNWSEAGLELEAHRTIQEKLNKKARGFYVPFDIVVEASRAMLAARGMTVASDQGGGYMVEESSMGLFIEALRPLSIVTTMGATVLDGLVGDLAIPRQNSSAAFQWVAEGKGPQLSGLGLGTVNMRPRSLAGAVGPISRKLRVQTSNSVEMMVRRDMLIGAALGVDAGALQGGGTNNEPLGLLNQTGIKTQAIASDAAPTWAEIVGMESEVATANALMGNLSYLTTPAMRGTLKTTRKDAGSGLFVWGDNNQVNGYRAEATNQMPTNGIVFGNWSDLVIGFWGVLDVMVDESTDVEAGGLILRVWQEADVAVRHPESFCKGT